jgi:hypothetical protein
LECGGLPPLCSPVREFAKIKKIKRAGGDAGGTKDEGHLPHRATTLRIRD